MILTDYYKFVRLEEFDGHQTERFDCVASTEEYPSFEVLRNRKTDKLHIYLINTPCWFKIKIDQKSSKAIIHNRNISVVYMPDTTKPFGYGDFVGTQDALLFNFSEEGRTLEVFVARGEKSISHCLYTFILDGELNEEIDALRQQAK
ncbi:MAG: hypothetical protein KF870_13230 [Leadbetterella sp.]|nr:hypothetical protein [Leadbetterella sp.]